MAVVSSNKTPLGKVILQNLYLNGKNQAWLAKQMNVNLSYVSILCSKIKNPTPETLTKLSEILNIEVAELYQAVLQNLVDSEVD